MAENRRVKLPRDCYRRWHDSKGSDPDIWLPLLDEPFELYSVCDGRPGAEFTAACACREDVTRYLGGLARDWAMDYFRMDEFVAQGDTVVAIGRCAFTHRRTGKQVDTRKVDIWKFRGDKAVSFAEFYDSAGLLEAAS